MDEKSKQLLDSLRETFGEKWFPASIVANRLGIALGQAQTKLDAVAGPEGPLERSQIVWDWDHELFIYKVKPRPE